jgi:hypothetical protein
MLVKSGVTLKDNIKFLFEGEEVLGLLEGIYTIAAMMLME